VTPAAVAQRPTKLIPVVVGLLALAWFVSSRHYDVEDIGVPEAKVMIEAGAVVVDVRNTAAYEGRHIPGAISIPLEVLERTIPASLAAAKAQRIVVYCGDGTSLGPRGTHLLNQAGYTGAVNLERGIGGWTAAGLPVQKSL
jgi:rhodanese-related sulfurtransferase